AVPAAANRQRESALVREADDFRDVAGRPTTRDHSRPFVECPVPERPNVLVRLVSGDEYVASEPPPKHFQGAGDPRHRAPPCEMNPGIIPPHVVADYDAASHLAIHPSVPRIKDRQAIRDLLSEAFERGKDVAAGLDTDRSVCGEG